MNDVCGVPQISKLVQFADNTGVTHETPAVINDVSFTVRVIQIYLNISRFYMYYYVLYYTLN